MILSDRLESIIELIPRGCACADIGCDHGFVSIELVSRGICPRVYGMDLREGPLERARENVRAAGLEESITLMLSDGFEKLEPGMVKTAVIAGMGGTLITDIIEKGMKVVEQMDEFVVQPQSNIPEFRNHLRLKGFEIVRNNVIRDAGKYYFPMKIRYTGRCDESAALGITPEDRYGADLIREDRGLSEYLEYEMNSMEKILERLLSEEGDHEERVRDIRSLMELNRKIYSGTD
ncbi:MAG: class I SAM-dependent methyltransferase [Lachnospiraceae bacterium]|nr:class I SAM-dependent methyltransferase [Lachnospiraceae bacterium]